MEPLPPSIATTVCSCVSGLSTLLAASGQREADPLLQKGATIIMMMSSTSMTSTSGVTLMSDLIPPLPPICIDIMTPDVIGDRQSVMAGRGRDSEFAPPRPRTPTRSPVQPAMPYAVFLMK